MTDRGTSIPQRAICPTHGPVDAVLWKGALVCPDPECHRTCAPVDEGPEIPPTTELWGATIYVQFVADNAEDAAAVTKRLTERVLEHPSVWRAEGEFNDEQSTETVDV